MKRALGLIVAVIAALQVTSFWAVANGVPVKIPLSYLQGVSNWGSKAATGIAEVSIGEAYVKIDAVGLDALQGETYFAWLINTETGDLFAVGALSGDPNGTIRFSKDFDQIPDKGYNLVLISVEPSGANPSAPSAKRSIAGFYPKPVGYSQAQVPSDLPKTGGSAVEPAKPVDVRIPTAPSQPTSDSKSVLTIALGATLLLGAVGVGLLHSMVRRSR